MSPAVQSNVDPRLKGRTVYIPRMSVEASAVFAAAYRAFDIQGCPLPVADARAIELAREYTTGEECYPEMVTLGGFLSITDRPDFSPDKVAFMLPTAGGPCRFGQYKQLLEKILEEKGLSDVPVLSPSSKDGYDGFTDNAADLQRLAWWALVCGDALRKLLLQTRPYETIPGDTDAAHAESLDLLCSVIERTNLPLKKKYTVMVETMQKVADRFDAIPAKYTRDRPLIGVVGEIYCRLDPFTNAEIIRRIEKLGGEAWLSSVTEWVWYTNFLQKHMLKTKGKMLSMEMLGAEIRNRIQASDEHGLLKPLHARFEGYAEPKSIEKLVQPAKTYLPYWGAIGEMVLNVGGSIFLHKQGVDGIIDISPFSCMNGIASEAIYPKVSIDHQKMPIRNFYFDGTESDHDRDVEIFLELATTYKRRKTQTRRYPRHFS